MRLKISPAFILFTTTYFITRYLAHAFRRARCRECDARVGCSPVACCHASHGAPPASLPRKRGLFISSSAAFKDIFARYEYSLILLPSARLFLRVMRDAARAASTMMRAGAPSVALCKSFSARCCLRFIVCYSLVGGAPRHAEFTLASAQEHSALFTPLRFARAHTLLFI